MEKIIIEVGSTVTKVDKYNGNTMERINEFTIFFKKNYTNNNNHILESDLDALINCINKAKESYDDIYVCGTSIFRVLEDAERDEVLSKIKEKTGIDFHIISQEEESRLTVLGTTRNIGDACVFIGGGGSTEIAIYHNEIKESANTSIGVMDVLRKFPDLSNDIATTSLEEVMNYIKENLHVPSETCDTLILAGGGHAKFALASGINYEDNTLYEDINAPIMMDINTRIKDTKRYYTEISLDAIRSQSDDPAWWDATRAMCAFVLVVAEAINAKYIVPTDIGMSYGIIKENV